MKRVTIFAAIAASLVGLGAGCGAPSPSPPSPTTTTTAPATGPGTTRCSEGVMGGCVPPAKPGVGAPRVTGTLIPDVSEYESCGLYSEAIFRVYEAGTERQDTTALCHAQELHRRGAWSAAYAFLRPGHGGCVVQAERTLTIVQTVGGVTGPVIADAEVPLPAGFVRCFLRTIQAHGYPAVEYTCPGCGDEQVPPVWIAAYPYRPAGQWVAHQFSSTFNCRGVYGDCSVDEGLLRITRKPPVDKSALAARRRALRRVLVSYGCRRREHVHERLGPRCARWKHEGDRVNAALRS